jgi:probable regulatory domain-containing protein
MSEEIPLNPIGKKDIHKLETILLTATLLRPEVLEMIRSSSERITWIDSLAIAAAALAREKAGMTITQIAEELGRTEQTIRKHLKEESKAGQLVKETYEMIKYLVKEGRANDIFSLLPFERKDESKKLKEELKEALLKIKEEIEEILKKI